MPQPANRFPSGKSERVDASLQPSGRNVTPFPSRAPQGINAPREVSSQGVPMEQKSEAEIPLTWPPDYPRHRPITTAVAREIDRAASAEFGIPSVVLMEHAARGVAELAATLAPGSGRIVICCGPGNNGGDGYGAARFLAAWGRDVVALKMSRSEPRSEDAQLEVRLAAEMGVVEALWEAPGRLAEVLAEGPELVVDALFGVGLERALEGPYRAWIDALNDSGVPVMAVDVPSGVDSDTGEVHGAAIRADLTATMAAPKVGLVGPAEGARCAGHVIELEIGIPRALLAEYELQGGPASRQGSA